jgi:hypothetical protein
MYSIAQQAVANGYGNNEYFRAQPTALSNRVRTTVSARSLSWPNFAFVAAGVLRDGSCSEREPKRFMNHFIQRKLE